MDVTALSMVSRREVWRVLIAVTALVVLLPVIPASAVDVLQISENTTLTANHIGVIEILEDGVTLDCAGYQVISPVFHDEAGIAFGGLVGVTVKNCHISEFREGFSIGDSTRITLKDNTVEDTRDHAFTLRRVTNSSIRGNTAIDGQFGYVIENSSGNRVRNNRATDFTVGAFDLRDGSTGNTLTDNEAVGDGVALAIGFFVRGPDNVLRNNSVDGYFTGISVSEPGNTITRNTATNNISVGIAVHGPDASGNTVMSNTASGHGFTGFYVVDDASDNSLAHNVAFENNEGFQLWMTSGNTLSRNIAHDNDIGFVLQTDANGNTLSRNLADNNNDDGFIVLGASNNSFRMNTSTNNKFGFALLSDTSGNTLDRNTADANSQVGFLDQSIGGTGDAGTDNHYVNNSCVGNTVAGSDPIGLCIN